MQLLCKSCIQYCFHDVLLFTYSLVRSTTFVAWPSLCHGELYLDSSEPFWSTHWGRVTHICVGNLTIIGPDNGLSPGRRLAIIWTNAGMLLIEPLGTAFSEISIEIITFSFKKIHLKMSSAKMAAICLGLNELKKHLTYTLYFVCVLCVYINKS